jgi:hypothetical protein
MKRSRLRTRMRAAAVFALAALVVLVGVTALHLPVRSRLALDRQLANPPAGFSAEQPRLNAVFPAAQSLHLPGYEAFSSDAHQCSGGEALEAPAQPYFADD